MMNQAVLVHDERATQSSVATDQVWTRWMFYRGPHDPLQVCHTDSGVGEVPPAAPFTERGEPLVQEIMRFGNL